MGILPPRSVINCLHSGFTDAIAYTLRETESNRRCFVSLSLSFCDLVSLVAQHAILLCHHDSLLHRHGRPQSQWSSLCHTLPIDDKTSNVGHPTMRRWQAYESEDGRYSLVNKNQRAVLITPAIFSLALTKSLYHLTISNRGHTVGSNCKLGGLKMLDAIYEVREPGWLMIMVGGLPPSCPHLRRRLPPTRDLIEALRRVTTDGQDLSRRNCLTVPSFAPWWLDNGGGKRVCYRRHISLSVSTVLYHCIIY
jgi:hypothetical protein